MPLFYTLLLPLFDFNTHLIISRREHLIHGEHVAEFSLSHLQLINDAVSEINRPWHRCRWNEVAKVEIQNCRTE